MTLNYNDLVIACALLTGLVVLLIVFIWSIKRHRNPHLSVKCDVALESLINSMAGLSHGVEVPGNAIEVLHNGRFYDVLLEDMRAARKTVHFETYLWKEGRLGERLADALCERSRAGLTVRLMLDASGTKKMGRQTERRLTEAGCKVAKFHPWHIRNIGVMNERDHRKIAVLDGRVAYVGGHCIVDTWLGDAQDKNHYRDLTARLVGPVVHSVQSAFAENWLETTGEMFVGDEVFPELDKQGDAAMHVAWVKPEGSAPAVKVLHHLAICTARKRLWLQNPYFLPEPEAIRALGEAVARGVDVRIMVPAATASDMPLVQHAAHRNFARLLSLGVRIFEYQKTLLHQKVMTVDGAWGAIGSTNFDDRAFEINDEITIGVKHAPFAQQLEEIFRKDLEDCIELTSEGWANRGPMHRMKDSAFYLLNELL